MSAGHKTTVALVKVSDYDPQALNQAVSEAVRLLGGWDSILQPRESVLIKPNLLTACAPQENATTHPEFVASVIRQVQAAGARPFIAESPAFGSIDSVAEKCGILSVARAAKIPLVELNRPVRLAAKSPLTPRGLVGDSRAIEADVLINLPKFKAHTQTLFTGAVKNLYGCVPGKRKVWWHFKANHSLTRFSEMLVENVRALHSGLTLVDAVVAMEEKGPRGGRAKHLGLLVAGRDPVAVDAVLAGLVGLGAHDYEILNAARRRNVGVPDLEAIEIVGERLEAVRDLTFKLPKELSDISFSPQRVAKSFLKNLWIKKIKERSHVYTDG